MNASSGTGKNARWAMALAALTGLSAMWLICGTDGHERMDGRMLDGRARLMAISPLPQWLQKMNAPMCDLMPVSGPAAAAWRLQGRESASAPAAGDIARKDVAARKPLRVIRDSHALFSAVAVDPVRNEVVVQDENLFRTMVYDRTTNTPASAARSEPKRVIGGDKTHLEFNCAVYIDPKTGDIYSVNNDTEDHLSVFDRQAKGNVPPNRLLHTPHGAFGIAVDEDAQEFMLTIQHSNAVVTFPKMADGEQQPSRVLQGERTLIADPHGIALDTRNNLIFVGNFGSITAMRKGAGVGANYFAGGDGKQNWPLDAGQSLPGSGKNLPASITVYRKDASGDAAPLRVITGPRTQLNWPAQMAVDSERGELYVANDMGDSVLVFSTSANGDVAPMRVLKGPRTMLRYPNGIALDLVNNELWVANFGNHAVTVYPRAASGDTAPIRVIRDAPLGATSPTLANPHPIAYDTKREEILVPN